MRWIEMSRLNGLASLSSQGDWASRDAKCLLRDSKFVYRSLAIQSLVGSRLESCWFWDKRRQAVAATQLGSAQRERDSKLSRFCSPGDE